MKLCFLASSDAAHSHRWIRFFADKGHEIHWISMRPFGAVTLPNTKFYDLSSAYGKFASLGVAAFKIRRIIREIDPEIVHAHYAGSYGVLGALSQFQPFVLTAWGSDILFAGHAPAKGMLVRWVLRKAARITCDAHHMVEAMHALGADKKKIELVFFGVEVDRFCPGSQDDEVRSIWGVQTEPVVISLRNLEPVYSIETLIEAVPRVIEEVPKVRIVIAGSGSRESALKALAHRLDIEANVIFSGRYANSDLPKMLRSADAYVSTSLSDAGIAASTAEAMACGLPVVVTNTGENHRWIEEGKTGFLIAPKDSRTLAERVVKLLKDAPRRIAMGLAAREVIVHRNNYDLEMDRMEKIYQGLLNGRTVKTRLSATIIPH